MVKTFFLKWSRSSKIMQNVIFHAKLYSPTLKWTKVKLKDRSGNVIKESVQFQIKRPSIQNPGGSKFLRTFLA